MDKTPIISVLLVDDNPANLLAMSAALEGMATEVVTAASGMEALRCLLRAEFAAILMDVQMPGLDGFQTAEIIRGRASARDIPIIFVTAISRANEHVTQGYALGAVDYLFKPVPADMLRAKVAVFVDLARKRALIQQQASRLAENNKALRATAEKLQKANEEIAFANQELETFNSAVAHDLRAPLRSITGFSATLLEDYGPSVDEEAKDLLRRIVSAADWMGLLIDDMLHLSHCTHASMRRGPVDLSELAASCIAALEHASPERRVTTRITPNLSAEGDARLLRIALDNLLSNAWKFTSKKAEATIEVGQDPATGAYFVRDDGAGFDMRYAPELFGAFQRLHRQDEFEGNGIGLITAKRVIERHGGEISGHGELDRGATFSFTLPKTAHPTNGDSRA